MNLPLTEADFEQLSWHDCHIWGIALRAGDADEGDWTSDLVLDIDYILAWSCPVGGSAQFRVAAASLVFHGVTDLSLRIEWDDLGSPVALHGLSIDRIEREPIPNARVFLDRPYFRWRVCLNWPKGGEIAFGAVGFTQRLRSNPITTGRQHLSLQQRNALPVTQGQ
ncbi:MAG: hypothetical protein FJW26_05585 [Acidimicrobiia bacterium]|nr:hypothetical protein [Acidimicrobiia bacterium]